MDLLADSRRKLHEAEKDFRQKLQEERLRAAAYLRELDEKLIKFNALSLDGSGLRQRGRFFIWREIMNLVQNSPEPVPELRIFDELKLTILGNRPDWNEARVHTELSKSIVKHVTKGQPEYEKGLRVVEKRGDLWVTSEYKSKPGSAFGNNLIWTEDRLKRQ